MLSLAILLLLSLIQKVYLPGCVTTSSPVKYVVEEIEFHSSGSSSELIEIAYPVIPKLSEAS
jgi:hypothetical protein